MADVTEALLSAAQNHRAALDGALADTAALAAAVDALEESVRAGIPVLFAGNGGSAADAQHLAAELVGRFASEREALPAVALTVNTSVLTALGNDYGFEHVFARQVEALGRPGGCFVGISTSGTSPNVIAAARVARDKGMTVVAMVGPRGTALGALADVEIAVPDASTPHVQEAHIFLGHVICGLVEERVCTKR